MSNSASWCPGFGAKNGRMANGPNFIRFKGREREPGTKTPLVREVRAKAGRMIGSQLAAGQRLMDIFARKQKARLGDNRLLISDLWKCST